MGSTDPPDDRPAGRVPAPAEPDAPEAEQGPDHDDPTSGLLEDDELSVADRDLVEPGLTEEELGRLELGDEAETAGPLPDELGTPGGDEAEAAAREFDEDAGLVAGSEPADVPGATDDLFPREDPVGGVRDGGEEGLDEDFPEPLDDALRTGDAAWRESGPPDESDDLGGELSLGPAGAARVLRFASRIAELPVAPPVADLAVSGELLVAAARAPGGDAVQLEVLEPAAAHGLLGPPLRFADEEQRVVGTGVVRDAATGAVRAVHVATDRAMIFRWTPGAADWSVADAFEQADGASVSWLRLGVSREPFRLVVPRAEPARILAWRPGGPLLEAEAGGPWRWREDGSTLRTLAEDPVRGTVLAWFAEDERARLRTWGSGGATESELLSVADLLLAPGATAVARDGRAWLGCRDPELAALHSLDEGRTWAPVAGVRSVRTLALPLGPPRALVVRTSSLDEVDELWVVEAGGPARLVARATDLRGGGDRAAAAPEPIARIAVLDAAPGTVWVLCADRVFVVERDDGAGRGG